MNNRERKSEFRKSEESRGRKCPGQTDPKEKPEAAEGAKTVASGKGPEEERKRTQGEKDSDAPRGDCRKKDGV